ncbi:MAG: hypothetical protein RLZZ618_1638 [Pseudomonadota bacterium]|jgi:cytochrome c553
MKKIFSSFLPFAAALLGLSSLASNAFAQGTPSAAAGEKKAAMCIGCHGIPGYQASFPEIHKVPMISGQSSKYIVNALVGYQKNLRKHPTMRAVAASLSEQDMADLGAFYEKQSTATPAPAAPLTKPSPAVAEVLEKGKCVTCHGANFSQPTDVYPKLAGQHADYLYVALKSYQIKNNPQVGRVNDTMAQQVGGLNHAQLKEIAKYLSSLPGELQVVQQPRFR